MTLGQRIEARLTEIGMSQSELARAVGVGPTTINGLVRGNARWTPYIFKIAHALKTSAEYLAGETLELEMSSTDAEVEASVHAPPPPAVVGLRVKGRLQATGLSQSELARQVGMSQPGINALIRGSSKSSTHLHKIARVLRTTPAYLTGETDDPDADAPPPAPAPRFDQMMMPVAFPTEAALTEMYEAQLEAFASLSGVALARALAKRLPKALARLQADALYEEMDGHRADPEDLEPPATDRSAHRQARRT